MSDLNDFSEHNEAPVAVYVDDVYLSNLAGLSFQLYDLERVEVLKGPQGTFFGRNTTGGVIHFVTRKPSDGLDGFAEVPAGEFAQLRFEGALGGAFSDSVRGRLRRSVQRPRRLHEHPESGLRGCQRGRQLRGSWTTRVWEQ